MARAYRFAREAAYSSEAARPADAAAPKMTRLRREHYRIRLDNTEAL
jgi:hypothetical protein